MAEMGLEWWHVAAIGGMLVTFLVLSVVVTAGQDDRRLRGHLESRGDQLLDKSWKPFGAGWLGAEHARLYDVRYRDQEGNTHAATFRTGLFEGVYSTGDRIESRAEHKVDTDGDELSRLRAENATLRSELAHLKEGD